MSRRSLSLLVALAAIALPGAAFAGHGGGGGGGHGGGGGGGFHGGGGGGFHSGGSFGGGFHGGGFGGGFRAAPAYHGSFGGGGFHAAPAYRGGSFGGGGFHAAPAYHPAYNGGFHAAPAYRGGFARPGVSVGRGFASAPGFRARASFGAPIAHTWYHGGRGYNHFYRPFGWGGHSYYAWSPGYRFHPGLYGYFSRPWLRPYPYRWGFYGSPWYGAYGYYFNPYPVYYGPSYWLTDWYFADLLASQYAQAEASQEAAEDAYAVAQEQAEPVPQPVKDQVRRQVEEAVQAEQAQQPIDVATALADPNHVYAVSQSVGVTRVGQNDTCGLSAGDLLRAASQPVPGDASAEMYVVSAKKGSCPVGSTVTVSIADLQSFLNDFGERVEEGLQKMQTELPGASQPAPAQQVAPAQPYEAAPEQYEMAPVE